MTQEERAQINKQNASHSTGPKTEEGKAKSAQNAVTHGLSSSTPPLQNPRFQQILANLIHEHKPQTPSQNVLVVELAHAALKIEQIPQLEYEIEINSGLTLAEHFTQDKPTPLARFWSLSLRVGSRFNSLLKKIVCVP